MGYFRSKLSDIHCDETPKSLVVKVEGVDRDERFCKVDIVVCHQEYTYILFAIHNVVFCEIFCAYYEIL
jgi:hypothetical protein